MAITDDKDKWLSKIDLATVFSMLKDNGATEVLYKVLPQNANSKNQVYLASDFSQLGKIPSGDITSHESTSKKRGGVEAVFRSAIEFYWLGKDGRPYLAPEAKLIFYPQFPEVRFSGFLKGCKDAPSSLYDKARRGTVPGRVLVLGVGSGTRVLGITLPPESPAAREIEEIQPRDEYGALFIVPMPGRGQGTGYEELMRGLCAIHRREWVPSTRLDKRGVLVPCSSSNCNGNTLESLLGIRSNGISLPDFRGWEVKARQVPNSEKPGASVVTLFTPEPASGVYADNGVVEFLRRYGYADTKGRANRVNFGGTYYANRAPHPRTNLRMVLDGYDPEHQKRYSPDGAIRLLDKHGREAMGWSFAKLMDHWKAKHAHAAFVPAQQRKIPEQQYRFGRAILLGEGAEFWRFLASVHAGNVYYDPGIKMVGARDEIPKTKRRSQFRVRSKNLPSLYASSRVVDACREAGCERGQLVG